MKKLTTVQLSLILISTILMIGIVPFDSEWTLYLFRHQWKTFTDFTHQSFFEGNLPGASDPGMVFALFAIFVYFKDWKIQGRAIWQAWRPYTGFIVMCSLVTGLGLVHSIKWIVGRARPALVINDGLEYTDWYQFGAHFATDGIYFGSFPSGHTASVFILMPLAFILITAGKDSTILRKFGWLWAAVVFVMSLMMAIGRCMSLNHWISDSLGSICLIGIAMHFLFYNVLRVPEQIEYYQEHQKHLITTRFWEARLFLRLLMMIFGGMSVVVGFRALLRPDDRWLGIVIIPGLIAVLFFYKKVAGFYDRISAQFLS